MRRFLSLLGVGLAAVLAMVAAGCMTSSRRTPGATPLEPPAGRPADGGSGPSTIDPPVQPRPDGGGNVCPGPVGIPKNAGEACACDGECAPGFCQEGTCCSESSCGKRALGSPCQRPEQCESGQCADGVCCNVACAGTCVSCNQPDRTGECMPVPAGQKDPRDQCRQEAEETCGLSGWCNGQGGCAKYAPGTACGASSCSGPRTFIPGGECDGEGVCVKGAALECTPFNCEAGSCRSSCVADADCVPPNVCAGGRCGLRGLGQTCAAGDQCQTSFCVDGVCCENACTGRCSFCASPSSRGTCAPVRAGAPDPRAAAGVNDPALVCLDEGVASCGDNGRCDGRGACQGYENGATCRAARCEAGGNAETGASVCMNGGCRAPSSVSCAPFRGCTGTRCITRCTADNQCASGFFCLGGTCGKRPNGGLCSRDGDCVSGTCAQGRCCASECDAPCMACNVAGSLGTCAPLTAGTEDDACGDARCSACDGNGGCARTPGTVCQNSCGPGDGATVTHLCNAAGACLPGQPVACLPGQRCRMGACACPGGQLVCGAACVDIRADAQHCGGCNRACPAGGACRDGMCACPPERPACGAVCCDGTCTLGLCVPVLGP